MPQVNGFNMTAIEQVAAARVAAQATGVVARMTAQQQISAASSAALTLLVTCMLARTTRMLELVIRASCLAIPVTRPPIICLWLTPWPHASARLSPRCAKSGEYLWLRPDGETQVTLEYPQHPDGSVELKKIYTVVISTQLAEPLKAKRTKGCTVIRILR